MNPVEENITLSPVPTTVLGYVDQCRHEYVSGWLIDFADVHSHLVVSICINGLEVATTLANEPRHDLSKNSAFRGTDHAFHVALPQDAWKGEVHEIVVRAKKYAYELNNGRRTFSASALAISKPPVHLDVALVGKQGWLFLCHDSNGCVEQFTGSLRLSEETLQGYRRLYAGRQETLRTRGIEYIVAVVPGKESLYCELLPDSVQRSSKPSVFLQFSQAVQPVLVNPIVDLLPILLENRWRGPLCYKEDSHWNYLGALIACREILAHVRTKFPNVPQLLSDKFSLVWGTESGGDLRQKTRLSYVDGKYVPFQASTEPAESFGADTVIRVHYAATSEEVLQHPYVGLSRTRPTRLYQKQDTTKLPRAIVIRDSYADWMIPFLAESFQEVLFIWSRTVPEDVLESFKPDLLIEEVVDRFLITNRAAAAVVP